MANRKVDNSSRQPTTQTKVTIDKKNGKINQQWTQLKSMGDETKRRKNGRRSEGGSWSCWRNESGFGRRKNYGGRNWTESKIQIRTCKKKEVFNSCVAVASDEGKERTRNGRVVKKKKKNWATGRFLFSNWSISREKNLNCFTRNLVKIGKRLRFHSQFFVFFCSWTVCWFFSCFGF